ncbi:hypothetical protein CDV31_004825 [Fusarium ambrosium]|uniref:Uncharacterized protein n=1 Tax=Fusarium ambrosium TaxID=131363 RepID=A0A428UN69_9HYPO|nr:hypothetical protein CDV31_004825 [Fusarium ambrosium]
MPIIALDGENEHVLLMVEMLKYLFKLKDIKYTALQEKRGQIVVTIPRKLTKDEQESLDKTGEGKGHNKTEPEQGTGKPKESNTKDAAAGNTTQGKSAASPKPPHDNKK